MDKEQYNKELRNMKRVVAVLGTFFVFSLVLSFRTMVVLAVMAGGIGTIIATTIVVYRGFMWVMTPKAKVDSKVK